MKTSFNPGDATLDTIGACKPTVVKSIGPPGPVSPLKESGEKCAGIDAFDASSLDGVSTPSALPGLVSRYFGASGRLILDQYGSPCAVLRGEGNPKVLRLRSAKASAVIARGLRLAGMAFTKKAVTDATEALIADAQLLGERVMVWNRVGNTGDGTVVIALYDEANTQVWIHPGNVQIVASGSDVLFVEGPHSKGLPKPMLNNNSNLYKKYVNLDAFQGLIFLAYLTYVIAHPKANGSIFPVLAIVGGQGSGKGFTCKFAVAVIDPTTVGLRRIPTNVADLAIVTASHHAVVFDNLRHITLSMSDALCIASTGGAYSSRTLYTNDEQSVLWLHTALILNGIHAFIQEPDLAQRSIVLQPKPIPEEKRQSESEMWVGFEAELPQILGGLYQLIAQIMVHLPNVQVTHPQRMLDFVKWLAAMEMVHGAPVGTYQELYSEMVNAGQLDSVRDDLLGSTVLDFVQALDGTDWIGTPQELLTALSQRIAVANSRIPRGWPETPISLSKRLTSLQTALMTQGIELNFTRGKKRQISIQYQGQKND